MSRIQPVASEAASQPNSATSAVDCFGSTTTELRVRGADDVVAEALTFQQIGTSLAQTGQTRKRVSGESRSNIAGFTEEKVVSRPGIEPGTFRLRVCCNS